MKSFDTSILSPSDISAQEREWVYNGLDCCVTAEVLEVLLPQLDNNTASTYEFSRRLQGPLLEMRLRGVRVDSGRRACVIAEYRETLDKLESQLERIVAEGVGFYGFNWQSPKQLMELFYDRLKIPPIRRQGRITVNREALEKMESYLIAKPIVAHLTAMRDLVKKISMLKTEIDSDSRMRTSYNIAGTSTGRLSSSFSEFGTGTNMQNIEESLRSIFISDPGMKMAYFDAEQGESRVVGAIEGNLFDDWRYLDACEAGDLHTNVAKLVWPKLPWTGRLAEDRAIAEQPYYRHYDRRFMCKKIGHGSNYGGQPYTLSQQAKVEVRAVEEFQPKYFAAFPAHLRWHGHVRQCLVNDGYLISLMGRKRQFWGRRNDNSTLREAIAYDPQGSLADIVNTGMLRVWHDRIGVLLFNDHDAITVQYPEEKEDEVIPKILASLRVPLDLNNGRQFVVPFGCKTGWNKGLYNAKTNPDGLKTYVHGDQRRRTPTVPVLQRTG